MAQTYSPAENARSTMGAKRLNFCVRDGNRWTLLLNAPRKIVQATIFIVIIKLSTALVVFTTLALSKTLSDYLLNRSSKDSLVFRDVFSS